MEGEENDGKRMGQWFGIILFFLLVPAMMLYSTFWIINLLARSSGSSTSLSNAAQYFDDAPMILLAFYAGAVGSVVSYIYGRVSLAAPSDRAIRKMARLLFGGTLGVVAFFVSSSGLIIKFLYPKFPVDQLANALVGYQSIILISFVAGLVAPAIVRAIQRKSDQFADAGFGRQQKKP
jgi:hypothetical protein